MAVLARHRVSVSPPALGANGVASAARRRRRRLGRAWRASAAHQRLDGVATVMGRRARRRRHRPSSARGAPRRKSWALTSSGGAQCAAPDGDAESRAHLDNHRYLLVSIASLNNRDLPRLIKWADRNALSGNGGTTLKRPEKYTARGERTTSSNEAYHPRAIFKCTS